jgi:hypothetical protein
MYSCFTDAGEEENGSIGFREAVSQNLRWFEGVQLILISNTNWVGESAPCLTYGMRGMMSVSVSVSGPVRDVHSGNDGGVFCEPMMDLMSVLASLVKPGTSSILVCGLILESCASSSAFCMHAFNNLWAQGLHAVSVQHIYLGPWSFVKVSNFSALLVVGDLGVMHLFSRPADPGVR